MTGAGLLLVGSATWMALQPPPVPSEPQLFVLDVGQGDALLLRHAERAVLIDAGGFPGIDFDPGARIVAPVLHHLGVKRLSAVAVTHPHVDHAGGIVAILERFPVDEVWLGAAPPDDRVLRRVLAAAAARGIATMTPIAGRRLVGCDWENSMPNDATLRAAAKRVGNEASLVLAVTCGLRRLLLTGDAGEPSERNWPLHRLRQGLLKVGHHGSDSSTSSWLLERLRPRHAVISVGARNVYGLPRHAVLQRLRQRGIAIYRTDRDGALSFRLGTRLRVHGQRWRSGRG